MKDDDGRLLFPQLTAFVKAFLTLSHGNAGPEQGFSINKAILDAHGTRLGEDTIIALRRVKHRLIQVGGVAKFQITRPLIDSVKLSRKRYEEEQKALAEKKKKKANKKGNDIQDIETEIKNLEKGIEVADQAISEGSSNLEAHLNAKHVDTKKLQADNHMIQMGLQRKRKLLKEISELIKKKKAKISSAK